MQHVQRPIHVIYTLAVVILLASSYTPTSISAATPITWSAVTPIRVGASADYATDERGSGWEFNGTELYAEELTRTSFTNGGGVQDGNFVGTTNTGDPKIWLQDMNIPRTVPVSNEGSFNPIDTSRYRYLTYRMYASAPSSSIVYYHKDKSFAPNTFGATTFTTVFQGWHTYTFDMATQRLPEAGGLAWTDGLVQSIALKPATSAGVLIKLDYMRLSPTPPRAGAVVTATWTPVRSSLTCTSIPRRVGPTPRSLCVALRKSWAVCLDHAKPGTGNVLSDRPFTSGQRPKREPAILVNAPPSVRILSPSYTSGPDYAASVAGNAWDMASSADISVQFNVTDGRFGNGIFTGRNTNGDPGLVLNVPTPIDPTRFYYLTYRMRLQGQQDIFRGSIARILWWDGANIAATATATRDIVVYEGWRTVSIDLRSVLLEADAHSVWLSGTKLDFASIRTSSLRRAASNSTM